jgi:hypothetical protein
MIAFELPFYVQVHATTTTTTTTNKDQEVSWSPDPDGLPPGHTHIHTYTHTTPTPTDDRCTRSETHPSTSRPPAPARATLDCGSRSLLAPTCTWQLELAEAGCGTAGDDSIMTQLGDAWLLVATQPETLWACPPPP